MASVAIRVDEKTHALLQLWAQEEQKSIGRVVTELVERRATEQFWKEMREDFSRLRTEPIVWKDYQDEVALWESGVSSDSMNETT